MNFKKILILSLFLIAIAGIITPANALLDSYNVKTVSKEKSVKIKIKWDGNGGKVGTKTVVQTSLKKGSKINKLATTPKRTNYSFKGWYTKKTGGKKITKNTKPTKSVTYFAHWTKKSSSRVLNTEEKKLVGMWTVYIMSNFGTYENYMFTDKGRFIFQSGTVDVKTGNYKASGGKITFSNIVHTKDGVKKDYPNTQVAEYNSEKK